MVLPLHIFEPRYLLMIGECVRDNTPFGVALIREGMEVGGTARTYDFGTSAYVTHVEQLPNQRLNIQTVGYQRFRLHAIQDKKPYLVGIVEDLPLPGEDDPGVATAADRLASRLRTYLATLQKAGALDAPPDKLPENGTALAFLTAILLPLRLDEKQDLLESESLLALLNKQAALLRRELMLLESVLLEEPPRDPDSPLSPN
jgi:Lon protease-like protein